MERPSKQTILNTDAPAKIPEIKNVVFFHPDLGIGGAERLVVDAAVGLKTLGHNVTIFTSHHDKSHCFDETRDGTLDVRVRGSQFIPATIFGRFKILFSVLRQISLLIVITRSGELAKLKPTVFFMDQLSAGIPFLRWFWEDTYTLFYCHFPDLLLVQNRKAWHKRIWRLGFDWLEGWGLRGADKIVVNSGFTKSVVQGVWPGLGKKQDIGILYPCVDPQQKSSKLHQEPHDDTLWKGKKLVLSINRFERKKDLALALKAFAGLKATERKGTRLVVAGGYDTRVAENVAYVKELEALSTHLKLKYATVKNVVSAQAIPDDIEVLFLLSVPDQVKQSLIEAAALLLYTPSDEHFGIVPLEAMRLGVPVLAADSGGPLETVVDGECGWLRSPDKIADWTSVIRNVLHNLSPQQLHSLGENGRLRVEEEFSLDKMATRLNKELDETITGQRPPAAELGDIGIALILYIIFGAIVFVIVKEGVRPQRPGVENRARDYQLGFGIIAGAILGAAAVTWKLMQNESAFS